MPEQEHPEAAQDPRAEDTHAKDLRTEEARANDPREATETTLDAQAEARPDGLNPLERRILGLERRNFKHQGTKERAIKALGLTPIAYYQMLNVMLDDARVRSAAPRLVAALRTRRDAD